MQSRVWTEPGRVAVAAAFCAGAAIIGLLAAPAQNAARADEAAGSEQTSKQTSEPARAPSAPLRVVYNPSPPFAITDSQGRADGFGIDILKIIAANAGYALSFREVMNIAEALDLIEAGQADIHPALATNAARREIMSYSSPIGAVRLRLYARADRAATLDPDDLTGARIGSLQGGTTMMAAQSIIGAISTPRQSARDQVAGLEDGSLDLAVFVESAFDALRRAYAPNTRFVSVGPPVQSTPIGIAVTNRLPEALALLDAALHDLKSEARFAELSQRWVRPAPVMVERGAADLGRDRRDRRGAGGGGPAHPAVARHAAPPIAGRKRQARGARARPRGGPRGKDQRARPAERGDGAPAASRLA